MKELETNGWDYLIMEVIKRIWRSLSWSTNSRILQKVQVALRLPH